MFAQIYQDIPLFLAQSRIVPAKHGRTNRDFTTFGKNIVGSARKSNKEMELFRILL